MTIARTLDNLYQVSDSGCWIWLGEPNGHGYGIWRRCVEGVRVGQMAHRAMYEHLIGPIPDGLQLDHLCRNKLCVNPVHLEPVTARENTFRAGAITKVNADKTHCPQGHPYDAENTYVIPSGGRACRACRRAADRRHKARRSAGAVGQS